MIITESPCRRIKVFPPKHAAILGKPATDPVRQSPGFFTAAHRDRFAVLLRLTSNCSFEDVGSESPHPFVRSVWLAPAAPTATRVLRVGIGLGSRRYCWR